MSTLTYAVHDSATMLRRNLRHAVRYPSVSLGAPLIPVMMLLLFVYAFGDSIGSGIGGAGATRDLYLEYLTPGIVVMAVASGSMSTSISVCSDMTEGIINRFRTMDITRSSFVTGHVLGSVVQTMFSVAVVLAVAVAVGFRPDASAVEWLAATGLLMLAAFALTWLSVAFGLISRTVEAASNKPLLIQFLPFIGSAFVPAESMSPGLRWFAENQPFTPITEALRGLLTGSPIGNDAWSSLAWCVGIALAGYLWSRSLFDRDATR
ncbi:MULTISPECIES: ABC transporter permease [unclassified Streptomyces]|uniref:ABC transporter permease n=1 Tax=unclassified Streptomyces TaxID=2593676 RepID=UPI0033ACFB45